MSEHEPKANARLAVERRPLLDTRAAGTYTGLGERYIRRLRSERRVACVRIGGRVLFDPDDLDHLIDQHREPAMRALTEGAGAVPVGTPRRNHRRYSVR